MTFRESLAVGSDHQWHVCVRRRGKAEEFLEHDLTRRGGEQIIAPDHLADAHLGIVDHDREVVGRKTVGPTDDEVVHGARERAVHAIDERSFRAVGAKAQRGSSSLRLAFGSGGTVEFSTGSRVRADEHGPVGCG